METINGVPKKLVNIMSHTLAAVTAVLVYKAIAFDQIKKEIYNDCLTAGHIEYVCHFVVYNKSILTERSNGDD